MIGWALPTTEASIVGMVMTAKNSTLFTPGEEAPEFSIQLLVVFQGLGSRELERSKLQLFGDNKMSNPAPCVWRIGNQASRNLPSAMKNGDGMTGHGPIVQRS
uniref:Uncharacterized protein n=1 Tax=Coccidioides posadasii RMSCC 3488 TaxID=454284 RepID=A0A0J6I8Q9_COCPO|nr:hypothetical protein CPAG_04245 [Coccidioides posadasii RMSCC 3488]